MPKCKRKSEELLCAFWSGQSFRDINDFCKKVGKYCQYTTDGDTRVVTIYGHATQRVRVPPDHWVTFEDNAIYVYQKDTFERLYEVI